MKLKHFTVPQNDRLRNLGKIIASHPSGNTIQVSEAKAKRVSSAFTALKDENNDAGGMDAAIHTITDSKHLHKKLAHHD